MNDIDFLPRSWHEAQHHRLRRTREVLLVVLTVVAIFASFVIGNRQLSRLHSRVAVMRTHATLGDEQSRQLAALKLEQTRLLSEVRDHRHLKLPINTVDVLRVLGRELPISVALVELGVEAPKPGIQPSGDGSLRMSIYLVAHAPDEDTIATVVDALVTHPIFEDVQMPYSRPVLRDGVAGREFRVEMRVPLDRNYRLEPAGREVADAG